MSTKSNPTTDDDVVTCPVDGCGYTGPRKSVIAHYSGKPGDEHPGGYFDAREKIGELDASGSDPTAEAKPDEAKPEAKPGSPADVSPSPSPSTDDADPDTDPLLATPDAPTPDVERVECGECGDDLGTKREVMTAVRERGTAWCEECGAEVSHE